MSTTTLDALTQAVLEYGAECIRVGTGQAVGHEAQAKFDALQSAMSEALAAPPRTLLEQYDREQLPGYHAGYEDGRRKGYEVGHRHALAAPPVAPAAPVAPTDAQPARCERDGGKCGVGGFCEPCPPMAAPVAPQGWRMILVKSAPFDDLMYWLDRCEHKGHLENCADLVDPWSAFEYQEIAAAPPAPAAAPAIDDPVTVPRGLLGAACSAIDHKRDAPKVLAELRRYTVGDLSPPLPPYAPPAAAPAEPVGVPSMVWEALQRMIEDAATRGPASREDALAVAQWRRRLMTEPQDEICGCNNGVLTGASGEFIANCQCRGKSAAAPAEGARRVGGHEACDCRSYCKRVAPTEAPNA